MRLKYELFGFITFHWQAFSRAARLLVIFTVAFTVIFCVNDYYCKNGTTMLNHIKNFFQLQLEHVTDNNKGKSAQHTSNLACAALLIEVAIIDNHFDNKEFDILSGQLIQQLNITDAECDQLITLAKQEQKEATSTYQFTQLINQHYSEEQKSILIKSMWLVAYADGNIDKYEEHVIRKVADLIYVSHAQLIKAKIEARDS